MPGADLQPGQRITHADFGAGVVVDTPQGGYVRVFFGIGERQVPVTSTRPESSRSERILGAVNGTQDRLRKAWLAYEAHALPLMESAAALTAAKIDLLPHQVVLTHRVATAAPKRFLIADEVGLTTGLVRRPLAEVIDDADPAYPWIALRRGPDGRPEALAVLGSVRGGALVAVPGVHARPARWTRASLTEWLGVAGAGIAVDWILAEPAAPLAPMRSSDGAPGLAPIARLRVLLQAERRTLGVAIVYSVVIGLLSLVLPVAVQSLVNTIAFGAALQPLVVQLRR